MYIVHVAKGNFVHAQTATARDGGAVALHGRTCAAVARNKHCRQPDAQYTNHLLITHFSLKLT
jgi:hypothetical protein